MDDEERTFSLMGPSLNTQSGRIHFTILSPVTDPRGKKSQRPPSPRDKLSNSKKAASFRLASHRLVTIFCTFGLR